MHCRNVLHCLCTMDSMGKVPESLKLQDVQAASDKDDEEEAEEDDGGDEAPDIAISSTTAGQSNADVHRGAFHSLPILALLQQRPHPPYHLLDALAIQSALGSCSGKDGNLQNPHKKVQIISPLYFRYQVSSYSAY